MKLSMAAVASPYWQTSSQHMARALNEVGLLSRFYVPMDSYGLAFRATKSEKLSRIAAKICAHRRNLAPTYQTMPRQEILHIAGMRVKRASRGHLGPRATTRELMLQRASNFDRATAGAIVSDPAQIVTGMPHASAHIFEAARNLGKMSLLNQVNASYRDVNRFLQLEQYHVSDEAEAEEIANEFWGEEAIAQVDCEHALADYIIVQSDYQKSCLEKEGIDATKVKVLFNGVDVDKFLPKQADTASRPVRALYVGQVGYRKGLRHAVVGVEGAGRAVEEFVVIGPSVNNTRVAERYLQNHRYLGVVSHEEIQFHYRGADVFILPSFGEGMVRAVLEALAAGLPVIVTPQAGYSGVVRDGIEGFIVPPGDPVAIAERLEQLAEDGALRQKMSVAARERAKQFSWTSYEQRYLGLLEGLPRERDGNV